MRKIILAGILYINIQWCISQTQQNFIVFIIVLGQHVSILIESASGPSKSTDPYLAMFKMPCGIPNAFYTLRSKDLYSKKGLKMIL